MKVISPVTITDAMLVSSTVPETDYPAYVAGTTYAAGALVIRTETHRVYRSLQAANTGNTPESSPNWWQEVGPTNRWSAFDLALGTASSAVSSLTIVVKPGVIDSLALFELVGIQLSITYKSATGGSVIYSKTVSLDGTDVGSVADWFFADYQPLRRLILLDLPLGYPNGELTVTITGSGTVEIGALVVGRVFDLGGTLQGLGSGLTSYSRKTTDEFGRTAFVKRRSADTVNLKTIFDNADLARVRRKLVDLEMVPAVWVPSEEYRFGELVTFGVYKSFDIDVAYSHVSYCNLNIEGLI